MQTASAHTADRKKQAFQRERRATIHEMDWAGDESNKETNELTRYLEFMSKFMSRAVPPFEFFISFAQAFIFISFARALALMSVWIEYNAYIKNLKTLANWPQQKHIPLPRPHIAFYSHIKKRNW